MAASGKITGAWEGGGGHRLVINWTQTKDAANCRSTVTLDIDIQHMSMSWANERGVMTNNTVSCTGLSTVNWTNAAWNMWDDHALLHDLGTVTLTVPANADGTHDAITIGVKYHYNYRTYTWIQASATIQLDTVELASVIATAPTEVTAGNSMAIGVTRYTDAYYHRLTASLGGTVVATQDFAASDNVTVATTLAMLSNMTSAARANMTLCLTTYSDAARTTQVGNTSTKTVVFICPDTTATRPVIGTGGATAYAGNSGTRASGVTVFVSGMSRIGGEFDDDLITTKYGAAIASYTVTCGDLTKTETYAGGTMPETTAVMSAGTKTVTLTVTDTRGISASVTETITVYAYSAPTVTDVTMCRCDSTGTADDDGTYFLFKATAACSPLGGQNSVTLIERHRQTGTSSWMQNTLTSGTQLIVTGCLVNYSYDCEIIATDTIGTGTTVADVIAQSSVVVNVKTGGDGLGVGGYANTSGLRVYWDATLDGELTLSGITSSSGIEVEVVYTDGTSGKFIIAGREVTS